MDLPYLFVITKIFKKRLEEKKKKMFVLKKFKALPETIFEQYNSKKKNK
jgi:hypothetical protein